MKRIIKMGKKRAWAVVFNGTNTLINCGSDAGLDNLADAAFTIEGWFRTNKTGTCTLLYKQDGWFLYTTGVSIFGIIYCATTNATALVVSSIVVGDRKYHHLAMTWDDAGDRKARIYVDGVLLATSSAGVGAVTDDSAYNLRIGNDNFGSILEGAVGWCRISNAVRYIANFPPSKRFSPPIIDANTIAQWNMIEGSGTVVDNAEGTAGRDGTVSNGSWIKE